MFVYQLIYQDLSRLIVLLKNLLLDLSYLYYLHYFIDHNVLHTFQSISLSTYRPQYQIKII